MNAGNQDQQWMARALELALYADYRTSPNPMVGAVVLDPNGELAGEGFHLGPGSPHAEQEALAAAGDRAEGGTIYVNLEPCPHAHRKPPCAEAIVAAGIKRAVIAIEDPDIRVRGAGIDHLRRGGVDTTLGVLEHAARRLNELYIWHRLTGRPFVAAKFAMSLDGKIATAARESRWITGPAARANGHRLRHIHDAILVGVKTVLDDDPRLSTRDVAGPDARQPVRIVLDSRLRTPPSASVLGGSKTTILATTTTQEEGTDRRLNGAEVLTLPAAGDGRVALEPLLDELGRRGVISLLVEGGGETHASFLKAGLINKVYAYIAPTLIGGSDAPGPFGGRGTQRLADAPRLRDIEVVRLEDDLLFTGYLVDVHRNS